MCANSSTMSHKHEPGSEFWLHVPNVSLKLVEGATPTEDPPHTHVSVPGVCSAPHACLRVCSVWGCWSRLNEFICHLWFPLLPLPSRLWCRRNVFREELKVYAWQVQDRKCPRFWLCSCLGDGIMLNMRRSGDSAPSLITGDKAAAFGATSYPKSARALWVWIPAKCCGGGGNSAETDVATTMMWMDYFSVGLSGKLFKVSPP